LTVPLKQFYPSPSVIKDEYSKIKGKELTNSLLLAKLQKLKQGT
jgi:hypothetical protein